MWVLAFAAGVACGAGFVLLWLSYMPKHERERVQREQETEREAQRARSVGYDGP